MANYNTGNIASKNAFKFDDFSHWIDYITFWVINHSQIENFFTDRIYDLDWDNSNFWVVQVADEILSIKKFKASTGDAYQFFCTYNTISIPIFEITQFSASQSEFCNNQWGVIHFYGAYFRLIELDYLTDMFISAVQSPFYNSPLARFDYRFDFLQKKENINDETQKIDIPTPEQVFPRIRKNKKRKYYYTWPRLQSWELGNKTNKTIFIRLYNKLDELDWNLKKLYLYSDIKKYSSFFRLEYEFWNKWCAWITGKDISKAIQKSFKTSWLEPTDFTWNLYKPRTFLDLSDELHKLRYIKIFTSMGKNLHENGICPYTILNEKLWT